MDQNSTEHIWNLMARKLSGEATAEDLYVLEQFLSLHPQENYSMEILHDLWKSKPALNPQYSETRFKELILRMQHLGIDEGKFTDEDQPVTNISGAAKSPVKWSLIAGALVIILTTSLLLIFNFNKATVKKEAKELLANNEVSTKYGSKSNLVLPDGTKVFLNAGSKLTYDKNFGTSLRVVNLSGEAFFDVVKNRAKPFIIHTRNMDIKVTGTAFNVKCYPEEKETETSLIRGSIEITLKDREEKIMLKPNEKLIIHDDVKTLKENPAALKAALPVSRPMLTLSHLTLLPEDHSVMETSWLENKLVFRSETFEEVAIKMERWFGVNIKFKNEKLKALKFTGVFEKETVDQALNALQLTTPFTYRINKDSILINK